MKLIDSSAWIEYYRREGNREYKDRILKAIQNNVAAVNGIIQVELLVFTKTQSEYDAISSDFSALHMLRIDNDVFQKASDIGFDLRRKGITVPATDLITAACALASDAELIHFDGHYEHIAKHSPLKTISRGI